MLAASPRQLGLTVTIQSAGALVLIGMLCAFPHTLPAQILRAPSDSAAPSNAPASADPESDTSSESNTDTSSENPANDENFVFAGDLARTLRKIDPKATVKWDGTKLNITANGQQFAVFPKGDEMVVNGELESAPPIKFRNEEVYIPQEVVDRIATTLEKSTSAATETTTTAVATPTPTPTPEPTATPEPLIPVASPTPTATPGSLLPQLTPRPTAAPTPATDSASPTPAVSIATPFPRATPTPTPTHTPTPTPTPAPRISVESTRKTNQLAATTEAFKAALRDKISLDSQDSKVFTQTQLEERAAGNKLTKVLILPDESGIEKTDKYGKRSAELSLIIAKRVKAQLDAVGMQTVLTRTTDDAVPVGETMESITNSDAQLLLVVSVGYSTAFEDLGGYRLFYMNDSVDYHSLDPRTFDASEAVPQEYNYRPFQEQSKVLVSSIKNSMTTALGNRAPVGMNPVPDYFSRRAPMASATVVVGYISNPADARRLENPTDQDAMAEALAEGIRNYATQLSQGQIGEGN